MEILSTMGEDIDLENRRERNPANFIQKKPCRIVCLVGFLAFLSCIIAIIRLLTDFARSLSENEEFLKLFYEMQNNMHLMNITKSTVFENKEN